MKKGFMDWATTVEPDILCIQETKAYKEQVDVKSIEDNGYQHYWNSAERAGYSGVAIFSKQEPNHVEYGTGIASMDGEGRVLRADFDECSVITLYLPNGGSGEARQNFKMKFCYDFAEYIKNLREEIPNLVVCGDYNICHKAIDIHDPVRNAKVSGFLPEEREWVSYFMEYCNMIDSFRYFNQEPHQYTWWSYRGNARNNNKGWRLDYHMVTDVLEPHLVRSVHLTEAKHSDHCPLLLELDL